jgi:hypothetical protein
MIESLFFELKGKKFEIEFPNVGKYRSIESLKQSLSMGEYGNMLRSAINTSDEALDMIDMEAYFTILCPQIFKLLKCNSFGELGLKDYMEIKDAYKTQFIPWWTGIEEILHPKPIQKADEE